jgi:cytochrome P450 PksS
LTSQDFFRNPAAAIENLRRMGPVVEVRFPIIGKVWATTTQALADQVLKDTDIFTIRREDGNVAGLQWWMPGIVRTLANSMLSMDEPDHKRLRDIVDEAFRRRAMLDMEPHIQATGDALADELFSECSPADLVERFARRFPLSVICELLGLPLADRAKFTAWASGFTRFTGHVSAGQSAPRAARFAAQAEPPYRFRHRDSLLPRPSARPHRRPMRAQIAVAALARTGAGR